ncbi:hypothetical protein DICPUDRAFT_79692 [Dictyostelium purpureum]|uniref:Uncharacterized protein n=1 Tax=Dictyostelium purpureum TaxID=5786 RepID=F0ZNC1_DICPU|nr:uncharacterized protein DICPUDRAFT_79692 [Dictyostelium purpureum]EGC34537.1 hypothetical protein DICPUDRAFT_79692 [Dictyostelium purpureum]|eukprot:XP_003288913.1 hypothetical protein DICPUDRAFT_79692 [Dictyostelium purpureum]
MNNKNNNNFVDILNKENQFLRNKNQTLNDQNTSLYKIIHDMKELMIKFNNFPKVIKYYENELKEKNNEIVDIKKKSDEEFNALNNSINKQIEYDNIEKKNKEDIIEGLKKTVQEIENQKYIDSNEYENQLIDLKSKIKIFLEKEKEYIKIESDLKSEKEWIINTKNNEILIAQNSKKDIEKQLNEITRENEMLKKQILNYQQTIKNTQQQIQQRPTGNISYLNISPSSSTSSTNDEYQSKSNIPANNTSSTSSNHLSLPNNKKSISITRKSNW